MKTNSVWILGILLQLRTADIRCAVPIDIVTQKVVPLKLSRPAIIPMIPDVEPIIPPSRRWGTKHPDIIPMIPDVEPITLASRTRLATEHHTETTAAPSIYLWREQLWRPISSYSRHIDGVEMLPSKRSYVTMSKRFWLLKVFKENNNLFFVVDL